MRKSETTSPFPPQALGQAEQLLGPLKLEDAYIQAFNDICRNEKIAHHDLYRMLTKAISKDNFSKTVRSFCVFYFATYPSCRLFQPLKGQKTYSTSEKINAFRLYSLAIDAGTQAGTLANAIRT